MESRKCQTATATPAKPGVLPIGIAAEFVLLVSVRVVFNKANNGGSAKSRQWKCGLEGQDLNAARWLEGRPADVSRVKRCRLHGKAAWSVTREIVGTGGIRVWRWSLCVRRERQCGSGRRRASTEGGTICDGAAATGWKARGRVVFGT